MKTYNVTNRISAQARKEIERIISTHEKYKSAYCFHPSCNASGRRCNVKRFANNNPDVAFIKGVDLIEVKRAYYESCKNVYYSLSVTINGTVKSISTIKKLLS